MMEGLPLITVPESLLTIHEDISAGEKGFVAMVERQSRFVFQVAYAILRNRQDAEDAVQETFLKLYRSQAWKRMEDEKAFLARSAWRVAVSRMPRRTEDIADREIVSSAIDPESATIGRDWNSAIQRMVDALPEELRRPLALTTVSDLNSREIAGVMGIPEGTVRTRIMRARQILKQKIAALEGFRDER